MNRLKLLSVIALLSLALVPVAGMAGEKSAPAGPAKGAVEEQEQEQPDAKPGRQFTREDRERKAQYVEETKQVVMGFVKELKGKLGETIQGEGPAAAIGVCREFAPQLAGRYSLEKGWRITRVSLKTRNTLLGTPDSWEQKVLMEFDQAVAGGADPAKLAKAAVVNEKGGRVFRFMKAMPVEEVCLMCHGEPANVTDEVKARLAAEYPHDRATGYGVGQIRGAISVKRPW